MKQNAMPCMNWKLIAAVVVGALAIAVVFPSAAAAVIPDKSAERL